MKKMKKILSIILSMVMLISAVNITAFADEAATKMSVTFSTDTGVPTEGVLAAHNQSKSAFVHTATESDLATVGADDWGLKGIVKLDTTTGLRHSALTFLHPADRSSIDSYYDYTTQDVQVPESVEFYYTKSANTTTSTSSNEWKKTFMQVIYAISPTTETSLDNGVQYVTTIYTMEFRFAKHSTKGYVLASRQLTNTVTECVYNDGTANTTTVSYRKDGNTSMSITELSLDAESESNPNSAIYTDSTINLTPLMKVRMTYDAELHACFEITGKFTATDAEGNQGEEQEFTVNLSSTTSVADGTKAAFGMYTSKCVNDTNISAFANPVVTYAVKCDDHTYDNACDEDCNVCGEGQTSAHNLVHVEEVEPTGAVDGNIEYWYCDAKDGCGEYYSDAEGTQVINQQDTVVEATGWNVKLYSWSNSGKTDFATLTGEKEGVTDGTNVTISTTEETGYDFKGWYAATVADGVCTGYTGDALSTDLSYTFSVTENISYAAVYEEVGTVTLDYSTNGKTPSEWISGNSDKMLLIEKINGTNVTTSRRSLSAETETYFGSSAWEGVTDILANANGSGTYNVPTFLYTTDAPYIDHYYQYASQLTAEPMSADFYYTQNKGNQTGGTDNNNRAYLNEIIYGISAPVSTVADDETYTTHVTTLYTVGFKLVAVTTTDETTGEVTDTEYKLLYRYRTYTVTETIYDSDPTQNTVAVDVQEKTNVATISFDDLDISGSDPNLETEGTVNLVRLMKVGMEFGDAKDGYLNPVFTITGKYNVDDGEYQEFTLTMDGEREVSEGTRRAVGFYTVNAGGKNPNGYLSAIANPQVTFAVEKDEVKITSASMEIGNSLALNYKVELSGRMKAETPVMKFTGPAGVSRVEGTKLERGLYTFCYSNIMAQEMADEITAQVVIGNDAVAEKEYSVMDYCTSLLELTDAELLAKGYQNGDAVRELVVDLIQYGGKVLEYRNNEDILNTYISEYTQWDTNGTTIESVTPLSTLLSGEASEVYQWKGAGLTLTEMVNIRGKFKVADADALTNLTVQMRLGERVVETTNFKKVEDAENTYYVYFGVYPYQYADTVTFTFIDASTGEATGQVLSYSVNTYLSKNYTKSEIANLVPLLQAINEYGDAALAYRISQYSHPCAALYGKNISILGDSISTFQGYSNNGDSNSNTASNAVYYGANKNAITYSGVNSVDDTYWMQAINATGMNLLVNNSYSGTLALSVNTMGRYAWLHDDTGWNSGTNPDIIAVYLGTNDVGGDEHSVSYFKTNYTSLLENIETTYPDAKIFVFTLMPNSLSSDIDINEHNGTIRNLASEKGYCLVDLYSECGITPDEWQNTTTYTHDNLHPNATTMDLITDVFLEALLEEYGK